MGLYSVPSPKVSHNHNTPAFLEGYNNTIVVDRNPRLYQIFSLQPGAHIQDIRKAYKALALQYHPDKNSGEEAQQRSSSNKASEAKGISNGSSTCQIFSIISEAYQFLSNEEKKKRYDDRFQTLMAGLVGSSSTSNSYVPSTDRGKSYFPYATKTEYSPLGMGVTDTFCRSSTAAAEDEYKILRSTRMKRMNSVGTPGRPRSKGKRNSSVSSRRSCSNSGVESTEGQKCSQRTPSQKTHDDGLYFKQRVKEKEQEYVRKLREQAKKESDDLDTMKFEHARVARATPHAPPSDISALKPAAMRAVPDQKLQSFEATLSKTFRSTASTVDFMFTDEKDCGSRRATPKIDNFVINLRGDPNSDRPSSVILNRGLRKQNGTLENEDTPLGRSYSSSRSNTTDHAGVLSGGDKHPLPGGDANRYSTPTTQMTAPEDGEDVKKVSFSTFKFTRSRSAKDDMGPILKKGDTHKAGFKVPVKLDLPLTSSPVRSESNKKPQKLARVSSVSLNDNTNALGVQESRKSPSPNVTPRNTEFRKTSGHFSNVTQAEAKPTEPALFHTINRKRTNSPTCNTNSINNQYQNHQRFQISKDLLVVELKEHDCRDAIAFEEEVASTALFSPIFQDECISRIDIGKMEQSDRLCVILEIKYSWHRSLTSQHHASRAQFLNYAFSEKETIYASESFKRLEIAEWKKRICSKQRNKNGENQNECYEMEKFSRAHIKLEEKERRQRCIIVGLGEVISFLYIARLKGQSLGYILNNPRVLLSPRKATSDLSPTKTPLRVQNSYEDLQAENTRLNHEIKKLHLSLALSAVNNNREITALQDKIDSNLKTSDREMIHKMTQTQVCDSLSEEHSAAPPSYHHINQTRHFSHRKNTTQVSNVSHKGVNSNQLPLKNALSNTGKAAKSDNSRNLSTSYGVSRLSHRASSSEKSISPYVGSMTMGDSRSRRSVSNRSVSLKRDTSNSSSKVNGCVSSSQYKTPSKVTNVSRESTGVGFRTSKYHNP